MATRIEKVGSRLYVVDSPYGSKDALKKIGCHWDGDRKQWWIGGAKSAELAACVERINVGGADKGGGERPSELGKGLPTQSEHDDRRVYAKVKYKGRNYYVIGESREKGRCLICQLSDSGFWVDMCLCDVVKTYAPREYRGRTEYTTLGSIRRFIAKQERLAASDAPQCAACGKRSDRLTHDLEDGMMKCRACCDMPE